MKITVTRPFDTAHAGKALLVIFARLAAADRPMPNAPSGIDSDLWHLESELRTTQTELGQTIEELEESNSELRVSNEEILSMNEELRSANEELETSKEELQAVNEQLNSVNAQLEEKVRQMAALSEDLTNLLASTDIATLLVDRDGFIRRFTPKAADMLGLAHADLGRKIGEVLGNPLGHALSTEIGRVLANQDGQVEEEIETADNQWYVRRLTPFVAMRGTPAAGVVVTWTDITHIKLSDGRARRLAAVVQDSNDAVTVFDLNGHLRAWNRAASTMYGYSETEALQMSVSDLVPRGARQDHLDFIRQAEQNQALHSYETQRVTKDGRVLDIWLTLSVLSDDKGKPAAVASTERKLVNRSVSNTQLRERAEQLAVADRRKNEFLAMLGHELRNPLAALASASTLLSSRGAEEKQKEWAAGVIRRQARAMTSLVNDMLDIARITSGSIELKRQPVVLTAIVQNALEVCQPIVTERGHTLSVSLPEEPIWLNADATRLSQVVENIVINAAKYTAPGGTIHVHGAKTAGRLLLRVKDNGQGIPPSMLNSLFDMFAQGAGADNQRLSGLGVGLSVVRRLVELHGGSVRALSDGRNGSEFIVDLPLDPDALPAEYTGGQPPCGIPTPQRILIIDDNADAAEALAMLLMNEGHEVETCFDGATGLDAAAKSVPDFVLSDVGLVGMDGFEVARRLRESTATREVILIAVTGYGMPADRLRTAQAGFDHHLTKPVDFDALRELLRTHSKPI
ncbi:PAS domain S-box-containing protein [Paraburkholderia sp. GAS333]|uniref:ATP-binding protein n=1 Tax=Paraburkholderia sp. GAS333 TaxID=3156279 RepID=UPI003D212DF9